MVRILKKFIYKLFSSSRCSMYGDDSFETQNDGMYSPFGGVGAAAEATGPTPYPTRRDFKKEGKKNLHESPADKSSKPKESGDAKSAEPAAGKKAPDKSKASAPASDAA